MTEKVNTTRHTYRSQETASWTKAKEKTSKTSPLVLVFQRRSHFSAKTERTSCFLSFTDPNCQTIRGQTLPFLPSARSSLTTVKLAELTSKLGVVQGTFRQINMLKGCWLRAPHLCFSQAVSFHRCKLLNVLQMTSAVFCCWAGPRRDWCENQPIRAKSLPAAGN